MDFRLYDNAVGRFWCMDALSEKYHYISPYHFGNNNPVFWSDPSGLSATSPSPEFTHDFMGRARFDKYGMFIPPFERQYKSITTDGGNGEGSGGGGGPMFETVDEILNHMLKYMKDKPGINSLTYKPGDGFYYYEQYSVVEKHKYKWNDETQQYDLGGAGMKLKKVYVYVVSSKNSLSNWYNDNVNIGVSGFGLYTALQADRAMYLSENFIAKYGDEVISATEITAKNRAFYGALAKGMGKLSTGLNFITTAYSVNETIGQYRKGGINEVISNPDYLDAAVGIASFGGTALVAFGSANFWNPLGWVILGSAAVYGGVRLVQDLNN